MNTNLLSTEQEVLTSNELDNVELTAIEMRLIGGGEAVVVFE